MYIMILPPQNYPPKKFSHANREKKQLCVILIVVFCKYISHLIESDTILGKTAEVVNDLLCESTYEVIWEAYRTQKSVC